MKKTKLFTSLAALALVLGLGACNEAEEKKEEAPAKTVLGAADPATGVYYYFNGEAATTSSSHFLAVTTSWDEAVDVSIDDLEEGGQSLSFVDAEGATKYISWSDGTAVDISDEAYAWYWVEDNGVYAAGSEDGRGLLYYADNPSFRAYSQTDQFLAYGHVAAYTEEPETVTPEVTSLKLELATSLESGKEYYLGSWTNETTYQLVTGSISGYNLLTTTEATNAATLTATGNDTDGWTLTFADGQYIYCFQSGDYADLGLSSEETVPESGVKAFSWSTEINSLYTQTIKRTSNGTTYDYTYLEIYNGNVTFWGATALDSATNVAHLYTVAA